MSKSYISSPPKRLRVLWDSFTLQLRLIEGRAMAQAVNRRPLTSESRVRARVNSRGI
jgi:hypothetical protein